MMNAYYLEVLSRDAIERGHGWASATDRRWVAVRWPRLARRSDDYRSKSAPSFVESATR